MWRQLNEQKFNSNYRHRNTTHYMYHMLLEAPIRKDIHIVAESMRVAPVDMFAVAQSTFEMPLQSEITQSAIFMHIMHYATLLLCLIQITMTYLYIMIAQ